MFPGCQSAWTICLGQVSSPSVSTVSRRVAVAARSRNVEHRRDLLLAVSRRQRLSGSTRSPCSTDGAHVIAARRRLSIRY